MKRLHTTFLWASAALFTLGGCASTGESVEITTSFLPNQTIEYQANTKGSVALNFAGDKAKQEPQTFSSRSRYRLTTSKADADGSITIEMKALEMQAEHGGEQQAIELPEPQSIKQTSDGKFVTEAGSNEETAAILTAFNQLKLPKVMTVGKKYDLTIDDKTVRQLFAQIAKDPDLTYKTKAWVKLNKADEQFVWGESRTTFEVTSPDKEDPFVVKGTQERQFKYNRKTHFYEELREKFAYGMPESKTFSMSFSSNSHIKRVDAE